MSKPSGEELQIQQNYRLIEALESSKKRYEALFQASSAAIMLLEGRHFSDCNQATLKMFACASKEDFCSYHPADLSPEFQPDGQTSMDAANAHIALAFEQGQASFEWIHRRMDGTEFPANVQLTAIRVDHLQLL